MSDHELPENPLDAAEELAQDLGMPAGTIGDLLKDDDWSFVIKLHVLLQAAVCHVLAERCGDAELAGPFGGISLGNKGQGLLGLLYHFQPFDDSEMAFLEKLAQLRNRFAHDIEWMGRSIEEYVDTLEDGQRDAFFKAMGVGLREELQIGDGTVHRDRFVRANTKFAMLVSASYILAMSYLDLRETNVQRMIADLGQKLWHSLQETPEEAEHRRGLLSAYGLLPADVSDDQPSGESEQ